MTGPPSGVPWKIFSRLDESAQHFGDTPGLGDAAARGEGRLGIEDLADRADAGLGEVGFETVEKMPCRLAPVGIVFVDPVASIGKEKLTHRTDIGAVEIYRLAPFVGVAVGEISCRKRVEVVPVRAEMVVDDVEDD